MVAEAADAFAAALAARVADEPRADALIAPAH
jgi:hypothetical protein